MNEFANLAGDVNIDIQTDPTPSANQEGPKTNNPNVPQAPKETVKETKPTESKKNCCPFNIENIDIENMQQLLNTYMGVAGLGEPKWSTSDSAPGQSQAPGPVNNDAPKPGNVNNEQDVEMAEANNSEADKESVTSDVSSTKTVESKKEESPEKAEDWTLINKEQGG